VETKHRPLLERQAPSLIPGIPLTPLKAIPIKSPWGIAGHTYPMEGIDRQCNATWVAVDQDHGIPRGGGCVPGVTPTTRIVPFPHFRQVCGSHAWDSVYFVERVVLLLPYTGGSSIAGPPPTV